MDTNNIDMPKLLGGAIGAIIGLIITLGVSSSDGFLAKQLTSDYEPIMLGLGVFMLVLGIISIILAIVKGKKEK